MGRIKTPIDLFVCVLVGFGCLSVIYGASCFPLELMPHVPQASYRLFNLVKCISSPTAVILALLLIRYQGEMGIARCAQAGFGLLTAGLLAASAVACAGVTELTPFVGFAIGTGVALAVSSWIALICALRELDAMLVLGWQSLAGSCIFLLLSFFMRDPAIDAFEPVVLAGACVVSAVLWHRAARSLLLQKPWKDDTSAPEAPVGTARQTQRRAENPHARLAVPTIGLAFVVLIYGIAESLAMGYDGSPLGDIMSVAGGPLGATVFLAWLYSSKNRDYVTAIKTVFFALLAVFWIPNFDVVVLILSLGYQLVMLLFWSIIIDQYAADKPVAFIAAATCQVVAALIFLASLYIPGKFGVTTYESYFESTSLMMLLVYLAFAAVILVEHRQRVEAADTDEPLGEGGETLATDIPEPDDDRDHERLDRLAKHYGLTKRECEVFYLVARGRDINYVCEELCLSRNTVKGHMKSLYAKLGIHSKQELIDISESP